MSDTNKAVAVAAEATGAKTVEVEWGGQKWTIPASAEDWSMAALEAQQSTQDVAFLRQVLGAKQFADFATHNPKVRDIRQFGQAIVAATGFEPGE